MAYCRTCGVVFESTMIGARGLLTLENMATMCPKGHWAQFLDGTFDFIDDTVRLVSGPTFTREVFEKVLKLVVESPPEVTAREIAEKATEVHPQAGTLVEKISGGDLTKRGAAWKATAVLVLLTALHKCSTSVSVHVDVNKLIDQMSGGSPPTEVQSASPRKEQHEQHKHSAGAHPAKKGS